MKTTPLLITLIFLSLDARASAERCTFESPPVVIKKSDGGPDAILLQYWDLSSDRILSQRSLPASKTLAEYRESVKKRLTTDPMALLKRYSLLQPAPDDLHNITAAASQPGNIKRMGCLEGLLLDIQINRDSSFAADGSEFISFFLKKKGKLRVYFLTNDSGGIRGPGFNQLLTRIDADSAEGWEVLANLHNHSFFLDDLESKKPQGVLAPSANDIRVFNAQMERFGLKGAYITNGFHTIHISSNDMKQYAAAH